MWVHPLLDLPSAAGPEQCAAVPESREPFCCMERRREGTPRTNLEAPARAGGLDPENLGCRRRLDGHSLSFLPWRHNFRPHFSPGKENSEVFRTAVMSFNCVWTLAKHWGWGC